MAFHDKNIQVFNVKVCVFMSKGLILAAASWHNLLNVEDEAKRTQPCLTRGVCEERFTGHTDITVIGAGWCFGRSIWTSRLLQWWHWKKVMKLSVAEAECTKKTNERQHECKAERWQKRWVRRCSLWRERSHSLGYGSLMVAAKRRHL